jgi:hypothetical protein
MKDPFDQFWEWANKDPTDRCRAGIDPLRSAFRHGGIAESRRSKGSAKG